MMRNRKRRDPKQGVATKMGRPRKVDEVVRVSRGVRLDPDLIERVNEAVNNGYIVGATNFSEAVERALHLMMKRKVGDPFAKTRGT